MNARKPILATLVTLCALVGALCVFSAPALAAPPEAPITEPAEEIQNTAAQLRGIPYPHTPDPEKSADEGGDIWKFEYNEGNSCGRGITTSGDESEIEGSLGYMNRLAATGLRPGTEYTFCMTVENAAKEITVGEPQSFTTTTTTRIGSKGTGSGQMESHAGLAVDQATGDLYVADPGSDRIDVFDASGHFLMAWGWGVNAISPIEGLQTCTTACREASNHGSGAGEFVSTGNEGPEGVAVDNELGSPSYGDVYVVDEGNFRVQKFSPSGEFLSTFGGGVNATKDAEPGSSEAEKDVCVAGESCQHGTRGTDDGQFEWAYLGAGTIAVGPGGRLYVGDRARVQVFEESGAWRENVSLAGLSATDQVTALAVNSAGDMFVNDGNARGGELKLGEEERVVGVPGVHEFEPDGVEVATQFDTGSTTVDGLALDGSGDLFVGDSNGGFHILMYGPAGNGLASFGANAVIRTGTGMAFSEALGELYVPNEVEYSGQIFFFEDNIAVLPAPVAGPPTIEANGVGAAPGRRGAASLRAAFNAGGYETKYHFEYVSDTNFRANGYANASSTSGGTVAALLEPQSVEGTLTGLTPGEIYHYRFVASNAKGTVTGPEESFEETPPALVDGPWVVDVGSSSATVDANIDPLGVSTEYRLEYGTSTSYGQSVSGDIGESEGYSPVSLHRQELSPGTAYHYRLVVHNEVGTYHTTDRMFTTQPASGRELSLPDGRVWELVSPPSKKGALIEIPEEEDLIQAAADGRAIAYITSSPLGEHAIGRNSLTNQTLSVRGENGWSSEALALPSRFPENGEGVGRTLPGSAIAFPLFSANLSSAVVEPAEYSTPLLSSEASERTVYVRDGSNGLYLPLVRSANVPEGSEFGGENTSEPVEREMRFLGATPDLSHVLLSMSIVPAGAPAPHRSLYEWSEGKLTHVAGVGAVLGTEANSSQGGGRSSGISSNGQRIVWWGAGGGGEGLYMTDTVEEKTVQVAGPLAVFQTMSSDGSEIFYLEEGELYAFDLQTETRTPVTAGHAPDELSGGVQNAVLGASEDGSYVYFVAKGVLASGGVSGAPNVYVSHGDDGVWSTVYVATLSGEDEKDWFAEGGGAGPDKTPAIELQGVTSEVSPNGEYVTFMSNRSLTGYDNVDAVSRQPDEEVYLYHAEVSGSGGLGAGRLVCASCDPTGARPVGLFDNFVGGESGGSKPMVDPTGAWGGKLTGVTHWIAGSLPGAREANNKDVYYPRYLSDEGRLFFNSPDGLVAQATNGVEDVYEYEPSGVGSCTAAESTFSERSDGCVSLVSSGTSGGESVLYDSSENGNDVFFITSAKLVGADYDTSYDVYDAHVCSSEAPCAPEPVSPPACTTEASCRPAPTPQPEIFGPSPSATFSGVGNVGQEVTNSAQKARVKVKAKKKKAKKKKKKSKGRKASRRKVERSGSGKASAKGRK